MANKKIYTLIDFYLEYPLRCDILLSILLIIVSYYIPIILKMLDLPAIKHLKKTDELTYIAYLSSSGVTLAGFIIAALTIVISVKSSLKSKGFEESENAMHYILSTHHYKKIVKTFIDSIIELISVFIFLYITWLFSENISEKNIFKAISISTFGIIAPTFRSVLVLFTVLNLEHLKKQ